MADPSETTQVSRGPAHDETAAAQPEAAELLGAIEELSARVSGLQDELHALRAQTRPLPAEGAESPGWEDGASRGGRGSLAWVRSLDSPAPRRPAVPRLLIEVAFLAAVAVAAAVAELDGWAIAAVMAGAWLLVALSEWTVARAERRGAETAYAPLPVPGQVLSADPSWFAPPVERTVLDAGEAGEATATKLPPPASE